MNLFVEVNGQWNRLGAIHMDVASTVKTRYCRRVELPRRKSKAKQSGSLDEINGHVSVTMANFQVGGHRQWLDLEKDGIRQVYLFKTRYSGMNNSSAQLCRWELVRCSSVQQPNGTDVDILETGFFNCITK